VQLNCETYILLNCTQEDLALYMCAMVILIITQRFQELFPFHLFKSILILMFWSTPSYKKSSTF